MLVWESLLLPILVKQVTVTTVRLLRKNSLSLHLSLGSLGLVLVSFASLLCVSDVFEDLLRISIVFVYLCLSDQILDMKTGPKPISRLLIPRIMEVLQEANCDLRAWTITVRVRQLLNRPQLRWETVHKHLEQMVQEQTIFRYEDPTGIVTYSKNPIVREKVLF